MNASGLALAKDSHQHWLATLQLAAQEVFELMLSSRLDISSTAPSETEIDLTAMIGLAGQLCGVLTMRCSSQSAVLMAARMLGLQGDDAIPARRDAAGEVCNMIAGNFKNKISGLGDGCKLSVPTLISGGDYKLQCLGSEEVLRTTMLFEGEPLILALQILS
jgi:chemotaxis protein CheX